MNLHEANYSFQLFQPHRVKNASNNNPAVEIRPNGRIVFNKEASILLNDRHFCMLGYDQEKRALGILPVADFENGANKNAFPVRYAAKGAYIGAKKFFKHFNILPQSLTRNTPFQNGEFIGIKL